jgi:hypothetical protein
MISTDIRNIKAAEEGELFAIGIHSIDFGLKTYEAEVKHTGLFENPSGKELLKF